MLIPTLTFCCTFLPWRNLVALLSAHHGFPVQCQLILLAFNFLRGDSMIGRNLQLPKNAELL